MSAQAVARHAREGAQRRARVATPALGRGHLDVGERDARDRRAGRRHARRLEAAQRELCVPAGAEVRGRQRTQRVACGVRRRAACGGVRRVRRAESGEPHRAQSEQHGERGGGEVRVRVRVWVRVRVRVRVRCAQREQSAERRAQSAACGERRAERRQRRAPCGAPTARSTEQRAQSC